MIEGPKLLLSNPLPFTKLIKLLLMVLKQSINDHDTPFSPMTSK